MTDIRLDLAAAARPFFIRNGVSAGDAGAEARNRLRRLIIAAIRALGGVAPPPLLRTQDEVLDALDELLRHAEKMRVSWPEIVIRVNRGYDEEPPR